MRRGLECPTVRSEGKAQTASAVTPQNRWEGAAALFFSEIGLMFNFLKAHGVWEKIEHAAPLIGRCGGTRLGACHVSPYGRLGHDRCVRLNSPPLFPAGT